MTSSAFAEGLAHARALPLWAWWLMINSAAGCVAAVAVFPSLRVAALERSWRVQLLVALCCVVLGAPILAWLVLGAMLHRAGLYHPPRRRRA